VLAANPKADGAVWLRLPTDVGNPSILIASRPIEDVEQRLPSFILANVGRHRDMPWHFPTSQQMLDPGIEAEDDFEAREADNQARWRAPHNHISDQGITKRGYLVQNLMVRHLIAEQLYPLLGIGSRCDEKAFHLRRMEFSAHTGQ
jgi:hypothetical protein